jgi:hypothetical protein
MGDLCDAFSATLSGSLVRRTLLRVRRTSDLRPTQQCLKSRASRANVAFSTTRSEVTGRYSNRQIAQLATKLLDIALRATFEGNSKEAPDYH